MALSDYASRLLRDGLTRRDAADEIVNAINLSTLNNFKAVYIPIENLSAGSDISARVVFAAAAAVTLESVALVAQGAFVGIDNSNTMVVAIADGAGNSIVSKTYNTATQPTDNGVNDLGTLSSTHKVLTANETVTFAITNGSTADPPAMLLRLTFAAPEA